MKPEEIKANLNRRVRYISNKNRTDCEYILTAAIFRKGEKGFYYQAELTDIRQAKSIVIARLDEIERTFTG